MMTLHCSGTVPHCCCDVTAGLQYSMCTTTTTTTVPIRQYKTVVQYCVYIQYVSALHVHSTPHTQKSQGNQNDTPPQVTVKVQYSIKLIYSVRKYRGLTGTLLRLHRQFIRNYPGHSLSLAKGCSHELTTGLAA